MIAAAWFYIVFRIFHIGAGIAWVGSVYFFVVFVQPTSAAIGPAAAPFMTELLGARRVVDRILVLGTVTILAGLVLYLRDMDLAGGFGDWIGTARGVVFTIGGVAAILAWLILYLKDMNAVGGFGDWIGSAEGLVFTIGALCAIGAAAIGAFGSRPAVEQLLSVGRRVAQASQEGGPPPQELVAQVPVLQDKLKLYGRAGFAFLVVAVLAMATARYW